MEPILIHRAAAENPTRLTDLEPLHTGSLLPGPLALRINESDLYRRTKLHGFLNVVPLAIDILPLWYKVTSAPHRFLSSLPHASE